MTHLTMLDLLQAFAWGFGATAPTILVMIACEEPDSEGKAFFGVVAGIAQIAVLVFAYTAGMKR